jgi:O-antigen ligase
MIARASHAEERAPRVLVSVAAVAVVAVDAGYLLLIQSQGGPPSDNPLVTPFVGSYFALMAAALIASLPAPAPLRAGFRGAAAAGLLLAALLTGLSIGAAVLIPAILAIVATVLMVRRSPDRNTVFAAIAGMFVGVALLVVGLQIAWQQVVCPASGESGGSIASWFGSGGNYECNDGVLRVQR